jgi:hypothetical protein
LPSIVVTPNASSAAAPNASEAAPLPSTSSSSNSAASAATALPVRVVGLWNDAHQLTNDKPFASLYANTVLFYGRKQSAEACIKAKQTYLQQHPDFHQRLVGEVKVEPLGSFARATFVKEVSVGGKSTRYPSYLVLEPQGSGFVIRVEGDEVTDSALKKKMEARLNTPGVVAGDWDGDGQLETVRLVPPKLPQGGSEDDFGECDGPCDCTLVFEKRPAITLNYCIGGRPVNEGDLNGDGADEIGILPEWWTSCWHAYHVFGLRKGDWVQVTSPIQTHCSQWEDGVDAISKDPKRAGYVIVRSTDMDDFKVKSTSVRVQ